MCSILTNVTERHSSYGCPEEGNRFNDGLWLPICHGKSRDVSHFLGHSKMTALSLCCHRTAAWEGDYVPAGVVVAKMGLHILVVVGTKREPCWALIK